MTKEELLKSKEYWTAKIQIDLFNLIEDYRKKHDLTKTSIAEKLGVSKGYVTQILNGDFDHKVSKLVELALAFDKVPVLHFEDFNQYYEDDCLGLTNLPINNRPIINLSFDNYIEVNKKVSREQEKEYI